jgi:hypothetical protein
MLNPHKKWQLDLNIITSNLKFRSYVMGSLQINYFIDCGEAVREIGESIRRYGVKEFYISYFPEYYPDKTCHMKYIASRKRFKTI